MQKGWATLGNDGVGEGPAKPIAHAAILAGGRGRRMGTDKVLLPLGGTPLIERVWAALAPVSERVYAIGGEPRLDAHGVATIPDRYPGADSLGGIATALAHVAEAHGVEAKVLCVACDMPFLEPRLLCALWRLCEGCDVVVPRTELGYEPLCAVYRATCLPVMVGAIERGNLRLSSIYGQVRTREMGSDEVRALDPELRSFLNINRPEDLDTARRLLGQAG